ncbi:MAG: DNA polymerase I, partial [Candidatus Nanopelagicaceae bacterium]
EREGYEADDLIATLTRLAKERDAKVEVMITTGDRDSFQLIRPGVTVLYPKKGVTDLARMDSDAVVERYGITPTQYPDFAALRGDPSDNLPSIPGVGEKTAVKWIQEHGSLQDLVAHADQVPGKAGESFRSSLSQVLLNRELTHLLDDVPLEDAVVQQLLDDLWRGINKGKVVDLFDHLEIRTLKDRLGKLPQQGGTTNAVSSEPKRFSIRQVSESDLKAECKGEVAMLFSDPDRVGEAVAISPREGEVIWSEVRSIEGFMRDVVKISPEFSFFGHGVKSKLRRFDETIPVPLTFDTELGGYLLNPGQRDLDLENLLREHCDYQVNEEVSANNETLGLFSGDSFRPELAGYLWRLREIFEGALIETEQLDLLRRIELPLTLILAHVEHRGIGFDTEKAERLRDHYLTEAKEESDAAFKAAGREFNVNSPKQLQTILFDELKLPKTKRIKSGYSTDADSLTWLYSETKHPLLTALLRIREVNKLASITDGLISAAREDRIHTTFQQTITATGRLSSIDPNLQNIPIRSEEGRKIRDCFIAQSPYRSLMTADYSQIEMRIMAHLSGDAGLIAAFASGEDLHNTVGARVFGVPNSDVTPEMRRIVKAMSYGLAYGLSAYGLAQQLDLSPGEAQRLMDDYFVRFGGIRDYLQAVVQEARDKGYTQTLLGRRRYLPDLMSDNRQRREMAERMALNAPIQGSAADIIKIAMVAVESEIDRAGLASRMILQVHDELILEVAPREEVELEAIVRKAMGEAFKLDVALEVNVGVGSSWDSAAH